MTLQSTAENMTNGIAAGAVTSPLWLPVLRTASEFAGILVPILGAVWLIVQIIHKIRHWNDDK